MDRILSGLCEGDPVNSLLLSPGIDDSSAMGNVRRQRNDKQWNGK